jgi:hypothetical protein
LAEQHRGTGEIIEEQRPDDRLAAVDADARTDTQDIDGLSTIIDSRD